MLCLSIPSYLYASEKTEALNALKDKALFYLAQGQAEKAYQTLKPAELAYSGDAQFNYLLGISAIDAGHPGDASWIFERVVAVMPHHAGARMGMARAFFQLKDYENARKEFLLLKTMSPPESASQAIEKYLAEIDRITEKKSTWLFNGLVYSAVGHDSNVNGAPTSEKILPAPWMQLFLTVLGSPDGTIAIDQEKSSAYLEVGTSNKATYKKPETWSFWGQVKAKNKELQRYNEFSSRNIELAIGSLWVKDSHSINSELGLSYVWRGSTLNNKILSLQSSYSYSLNPRTLVGGYLFLADQQYLESSSNNGVLSTVGVSGSYIWGQYRPVVLQGNFYAGQDKAVSSRPEGDKSLFGSRVGLQFIYNQQHSFSTSVSWSDSRYAKENSIFEKTRTEQQLSYALGYTWSVNKSFSLSTRISRSDTDSNIALYDSEKSEIFLRADYVYQ
ncbi:hypothetical protein BTE48_02075 [Oceanospirillum multiglobuliferum]|uniref:Uncharacterized protein n=2 Tax=Oceanospirillum multiglobuliferum TaxID=64969 RepID=A0A1V4T955_9GAMM|nr:hypothetical protein BTE48_02075 [Oceanospirillum multiglobuliferum]